MFGTNKTFLLNKYLHFSYHIREANNVIFLSRSFSFNSSGKFRRIGSRKQQQYVRSTENSELGLKMYHAFLPTSGQQ